MTQDDLMRWCRQFGVTQRDFCRVWPVIRAGMAYGIARDHRLRLVGLGVFTVRDMPTTVLNQFGVAPPKRHFRVSFKSGEFLKTAVAAPDVDEFFREQGVSCGR